MAWDKLCKPKHLGGLNLQEPFTVNRACGAKLWWRWLKEPKLPWAKHWKEKSTQNHRLQNLIRMQETPEGSPIWNLERTNRHIQEQSFWEIQDGKTTLFWEDAWQQLPKLESHEFLDIQRRNQELGRTTVNHYWKPNENDQALRMWIFSETEPMAEENDSLKDLQIELAKRRIRKAGDNDQLRWGKLEGGKFTLKETRTHIEGTKHEEKANWHNKVWDAQLWPKIKMFLWLLMHRRTLTWENLKKKEFIGPSRCPMCGIEEETMNHLLDTFECADSLWN